MPTILGNTKWYTVQEVGDCIGKAYNTVRAYMDAGLIAHKKIGNNRVVSHEELVSYLEFIKLPAESTIELRLGLVSPKTGKKLEPETTDS